MGWITSMLGGIGGAAASMTGRLTSGILSQVTGFTRQLSEVLVSGLRAGLNFARDAFSSVGRAGIGAAKIIGGILVGAIGALAAISVRAVQSFTALGQAIRGLSVGTGLGKRDAGGVLNRFGALGFGASDVQGMFGNQNAAAFKMQASGFGLGGFNDPNFAAQFAGKQQRLMSQGMGGQMAATSMRATLGMDTDAGRRLAGMDVSAIERNQQFQRTVQSGLGVDPAMIAKTGAAFEMLGAQMSVLKDSVLIRLGAEILPRLTGAFGVLTDFMAKNAGSIDDLISKGVGMAFNGLASVFDALPGLWQSFTDGVSLVRAGVADLVELAASGFSWLMQNGPTIWQTVWDGFLHGVDIAQQGWDWLEGAATKAFAAIEGALKTIWDSPLVQQVVKALPAAPGIANALSTLTAPGNAVGKVVGRGVGGDDASEAAGGLIGRYLNGLGLTAGAVAAMKWAGGATVKALAGAGAGAAGGAAGTGAAGGVSALTAILTDPLLWAPAAGAALGGVGYTGLQRSGALGKDAPGFWEAGGNAMARIGNLITGADYNANVTQQNGYTAAENAAPTPLQSVTAAVKAAFPPVPDFANAPRGSWSQSMQGAAANLPDLPSLDLGNIGGHFGEALKGIREREDDPQSKIGDLLREMAAELRGQTGELKGIRKGAEKTMSAEDYQRAARDLMAMSANYQAQEAYMNLTRH